MLYSRPATGAVTLIVPVVIPQLGAEVIAITGAAGAVAAVTVMPLLAGEIQVLSVVLRAMTVYAVADTGMFGNTPFPTHVVPPSILYSKPAAGPVTLIVAVGFAQVVAVVIVIVGAVGVVPATRVTPLLTVDTQLLSVVLRAITVYGVAEIGIFANTPFPTHVVPPSMLYSRPATGAVTLIVPVVIPQL